MHSVSSDSRFQPIRNLIYSPRGAYGTDTAPTSWSLENTSGAMQYSRVAGKLQITTTLGGASFIPAWTPTASVVLVIRARAVDGLGTTKLQIYGRGGGWVLNLTSTMQTFVSSPLVSGGDIIYVTHRPVVATGEPARVAEIEFFGVYDTRNVPEFPSDADTPGWRWDGTPGASTSSGYPYTVTSVAGEPPIADLKGNGVQAAITGGALSAFTVYQVYDALAITQLYTTTWKIASTPLNAIADWGVAGALSYGRRGLNFADSTWSHGRLGTSGGNNNVSGITVQGSTTTSVRGHTLGRHVITAVMPTGLSTLDWMLDGLADATPRPAYSVGNGIQRGYFRVKSSASDSDGTDDSASIMPIRSLYFPSAHSRATRLAVQQYLSQVYGVPLA